jgi:hypothetical protein
MSSLLLHFHLIHTKVRGRIEERWAKGQSLALQPILMLCVRLWKDICYTRNGFSILFVARKNLTAAENYVLMAERRTVG